MASEGPNSPATAANDTSVGTVSWSSPTNAVSSNNSRATANTNGSGVTSRYLKVTSFGFSIPSGATIDGIVVEIERHATRPSGFGNIRDSAVRIVKADGSIGSTNKGATATNWPLNSGSEAYASYGGAADLWGETWTDADINDTDFGAVLSIVQNGTGASTVAHVDHIRITVYYTEAVSGRQQSLTMLGVGV